MKRFSLILALASSAAGLSAADAVSLLEVSKINISRLAGEMAVAIDIKASDIRPGRDREVIFTPVVTSAQGTDSVVLPSVRIAGRNRYFSHLRNHDLARGEKAYEAGSDETVTYRMETPWQPWMEQCTVRMREDVANCCNPVEPYTLTPLATLDYTVEPFRPPFEFVALTGDSTVVMSAEGRAFVTFVVDRTELKPNYMNNPAEIGKIIASIDRVKNDPDATITSVSIKGFASPEGTYKHNIELAMGRTATLKEYVRRHYNFDQSIMHTDFEPEDWAGLIEWLDSCSLPHRTEILAIAKSDMDPDTRDLTIRRQYPDEYQTILKTVYPWLRHSDYKVQYAIRTFVDIDELKRVYAATPKRLRPVDFQRIAATYPAGSPEYKDVFMKAVEIYPYDELANINAANITMERGQLDRAADHLRRAGNSPEAFYSRGVMAALQGNLDRANDLLHTAASQGFEPADRQLKTLYDITHKPNITYHITPKP